MALKDLVAKKKAEAAKERPKPKPYSLADKTSSPPKVAMYGHTGVGKSNMVTGMVENGERVFVASTDFGTNGLATVKNALARKGKLNLLDNCRGIDLTDYEDIEDFWLNPATFVEDIAAFCPTVMVWDGFSSFNVITVDEYVLRHAPGAENAGELRYAGLTHTQQDWAGTKRGTLRTLNKFLACHIEGVPPMAKYLTALEAGKADVDDFTRKTQRHPLIHGTARAMFGPAFDVILQAYTEAKGEDIKYFYRCSGDDSYLVKSRGYNLRTIEEADPARVWRVIRETGGGFAEEVKA